MHRKLILASASPQRRQLLEGLGVPFEVCVTGVEDESDVTHTDPAERAQYFARMKAEHAHSVHPDAWIIGCDTLVAAQDGTLLEKAENAQEARAMIRLQSGKTSLVYSGLCVFTPNGEAYQGMSTSSVTFKPLTSQELDWWIGTGLWKGRSGSFQIDGPGQLMIERIEGDWSGVVGLPIFLLGELMKKAGWDICQGA
ncbi:MAG: Maf family protein [Candidatus Peribacteraceae bacterium]|nr:Maf family protein [Candidatus Peribacteraceae bacterium]MDD5742336.1 Maf family protein [Candidatus Peribacteraceae bacterium]